jgi:hypothetical protein
MAFLEDSANKQVVLNNLDNKTSAVSYTNRYPSVY